jgi:predicted phage terminase large subunit-like protein
MEINRATLHCNEDQTHDLGYGLWRREKGEILRPDAYSRKEIKRLQTKEFTPPYDLYYQQGRSAHARIKIRPEHFPTFVSHMRPIAPIVLSIDTAQKGGADSSYNVIQAWSRGGQNHFLLALWRHQCGYVDLCAAYRSFLRKYRPSTVLIEDTANGSALIAEAKRKSLVDVIAVTPDGRSKAARLLDHVSAIRKKRIHLLDGADWRDAFVRELVDFPSEFDDQVDAMSQYLAFMATNPRLKSPPERALGVAIGFSRGPITPSDISADT